MLGKSTLSFGDPHALGVGRVPRKSLSLVRPWRAARPAEERSPTTADSPWAVSARDDFDRGGSIWGGAPPQGRAAAGDAASRAADVPNTAPAQRVLGGAAPSGRVPGATGKPAAVAERLPSAGAAPATQAASIAGHRDAPPVQATAPNGDGAASRGAASGAGRPQAYFSHAAAGSASGAPAAETRSPRLAAAAGATASSGDRAADRDRDALWMTEALWGVSGSAGGGSGRADAGERAAYGGDDRVAWELGGATRGGWGADLHRASALLAPAWPMADAAMHPSMASPLSHRRWRGGGGGADASDGAREAFAGARAGERGDALFGPSVAVAAAAGGMGPPSSGARLQPALVGAGSLRSHAGPGAIDAWLAPAAAAGGPAAHAPSPLLVRSGRAMPGPSLLRSARSFAGSGGPSAGGDGAGGVGAAAAASGAAAAADASGAAPASASFSASRRAGRRPSRDSADASGGSGSASPPPPPPSMPSLSRVAPTLRRSTATMAGVLNATGMADADVAQLLRVRERAVALARGAAIDSVRSGFRCGRPECAPSSDNVELPRLEHFELLGCKESVGVVCPACGAQETVFVYF